MPDDPLLSDQFVAELTAVGEVDLLVGVPTSNDAATVGHVLNAVQIGLVKYFPRARSVVIIADAQSRDSTGEAVAKAGIENYAALLSSAPLRTTHRITTSYHPNLGTGGAWRLFVAAAELLRAKACAVISADLAGVTPECVDSLLRPVLRDGFDLVTPAYQRPKFDGMLIKNVIAPMVGGLYRRYLKEPAGTEMAFSGRVASRLLADSAWNEEAVRHAPELWATTSAIVDGYRLCQSFLGPKVHAPKRRATDIVTSTREAVGALFRLAEMHERFWTNPQEPQAVPTLGFEYTLALEPMRMQRQQMLQMFRSGVSQLGDLLTSVLAPETLSEIKKLAASSGGLGYSDELWVRTVYDFAASYHRSVINRDHLLQALVPLYRGRMSSFVTGNHRVDPQDLDRRVEQLSHQYEQLLPYLMKRWSAAG